MSALSRQPDSALLVSDWQADVVQLLDESHLVATSDVAHRRMQFAVSLGNFLGSMRETEVCVFYGKFITDLESFCYQLERALPGPGLDRRIDGPQGITSLLRARVSFRGRPETKFRFFVWHDADVLLRADHGLFGTLVDALAGVAAESEFVCDDLLLIQRAVFVGGSLLDGYAEDPDGQFHSWRRDGCAEPFWQVVTGVERPRFTRFGIDSLAFRAAAAG